MSDLIALRAVFPVWDAIGHGTERYPHDLNGVVRVPREVAVHLLHNGGYVVHDRGIAPALDETIKPRGGADGQEQGHRPVPARH